MILHVSDRHVTLEQSVESVIHTPPEYAHASAVRIEQVLLFPMPQQGLYGRANVHIDRPVRLHLKANAPSCKREYARVPKRKGLLHANNPTVNHGNKTSDYDQCRMQAMHAVEIVGQAFVR